MFVKFYKISNLILGLPKFVKRTLILLTDTFLCFFTVWFSFYLRLDEFLEIKNEVVWAALISIAIAIPLFFIFRLYKTVFRYSGLEIVPSILPAFLTYAIIYFSIITLYGIDGISRTVGIIQPFIFFLAFIATRLLLPYLLVVFSEDNKKFKNVTKALIYGAGNSGSQLVTALNKSNEIKVVGFLDDDNQLNGRFLNGIKIFSTTDIKNLVKSKGVTHILLATPSANRDERKKIINKINQSKTNVLIKTLPSVLDIVEGKVTISDIRDLYIDDILGREQVEPYTSLIIKNIKNKIVLVTGAGGSIGQEICRQIIQNGPQTIILLDHNEFSLYLVLAEIEAIKKNLNIEKISIIPLLGSVQDESFLSELMDNYKPNTVYHAAAYKHVPLVERNIIEGIKNNVFGTITVLECSIRNKVSDFVLVSTDKAVRPTNIMGASKRLAELCAQGIRDNSKNIETQVTIVRFGNVLGSSGSVIPKFKKQIQNGGPITLTHPEVTRYFMTIPEAAQLVIQAGAMSRGNDLFVLDMGKPIKIADLIARVVKLSGLTIKDIDNPSGDIEVLITGLRSGEKLFEELLLGEKLEQTLHSKILKAQDPFFSWDIIKADIEELKNLTKQGQIDGVIKVLKKLVTGFKPSNQVLKNFIPTNQND